MIEYYSENEYLKPNNYTIIAEYNHEIMLLNDKNNKIISFPNGYVDTDEDVYLIVKSKLIEIGVTKYDMEYCFDYVDSYTNVSSAVFRVNIYELNCKNGYELVNKADFNKIILKENNNMNELYLKVKNTLVINKKNKIYEYNTFFIINNDNYKYHIIKYLGKGKGGISYLVEDENNKRFVMKKIHDEPCSFYNFDDKVKWEIDSYNRLLEAKLPIPKLLKVDYKRKYILKEYIDGELYNEKIVNNKIDFESLNKIKEIENKAKLENINPDYFPTNFIEEYETGTVYYIDYEANDYDEKWDFMNWGIYYYLNYDGFKMFDKTGDHSYINNRENSMPIITEYAINQIKKFNKYIKER